MGGLIVVLIMLYSGRHYLSVRSLTESELVDCAALALYGLANLKSGNYETRVSRISSRSLHGSTVPYEI